MVKMLVLFLLGFSAQTFAQEWNQDQREVWETLETQIGHYQAARFDENSKHIHDQAVFWGPDSPIPGYVSEFPGPDSAATRAHKLFPLSVDVHGDTAIINAYLRSLGDQGWVSLRLHNTWIKRNGAWKLLATYNTVED